jgi:HTH-type transcriptional regulator / antitoxin HigA
MEKEILRRLIMLSVVQKNTHGRIWALCTEEDYECMLADVQPLIIEAAKHPDKPMNELLQIKIDLIEHYEKQHHQIDTSDLTPICILEELLDQHKMSSSDLGRLLGDRSLGSRILSGKRGLSKKHVSILSEHFSVSPALFF